MHPGFHDLNSIQWNYVLLGTRGRRDNFAMTVFSSEEALIAGRASGFGNSKSRQKTPAPRRCAVVATNLIRLCGHHEQLTEG